MEGSDEFDAMYRELLGMASELHVGGEAGDEAMALMCQTPPPGMMAKLDKGMEEMAGSSEEPQRRAVRDCRAFLDGLPRPVRMMDVLVVQAVINGGVVLRRSGDREGVFLIQHPSVGTCLTQRRTNASSACES